ncbi:methyltransferase domain-containing protein [Caballeronia sp. BR00000012568055]|uniref:methyltransferase domain-containing protein n=1 Tax=Caballeronia sp. BR00000012568055 TaxID=2918761 RepID=UPI0023F62740|nr:methyltransferase domain-containing protein [Caballeronia sp. BR00000012568055]
MKETSKASQRRSRESSFVQNYFVGDGIDIGDLDDPLSAHQQAFPCIRSVLEWNALQKDAETMHGVPEGRYDFVHSSHCLANFNNPGKVLTRWLELLKPGGYAVITVPDEDLYGHGEWPSRFNAKHLRSFTVCKPERGLARSVNLLELVSTLAPIASCERLTVIREHYDPARRDIDQTAEGPAECAIELVLRKREVPSPAELFNRAVDSDSTAEAVTACDRVMRTYPYRFDVYFYVAKELLRRNVPACGDAVWEQCVKHLEGEHLPRLYQVLHLIASGKLQEGFALREALVRPFGTKRRTKVEPPHTIPEWQGESLKGKSIAIWSEFGLGDEIFFLRFARIFREQCGAARVVAVCQMPLVELYEASGELDQVIGVEQASQLPAVDYWVFPHAIPVWLPLDLEHLPQTTPYLHAPEGVISRMPPVERGKLKVGIVFKGDPTHENDKSRSLPSLAVLDDVLRLEGIEYFSLQKGAGADEAARYALTHAHFHDIGAQVKTMAETASVIAELDVVIAVDTSVAHLAGAMNKPVLLMLPAYGDWRWHYIREDSPWYPSVRLYRCSLEHEGWQHVVERIAGKLVEMRAAL